MFWTLVTFCLITYTNCIRETYNDEFNEYLLIKPLPSGHVYTSFQFVVQKELNLVDKNTFNHFRLFPRSLGEIVFQHDVQELHFSLTQGLWRYEKWGYPIRSAPPGAELWAIFKGNESEISSNWKKLTHVFSGQFCASLNFIDSANTAIPKLSFRPEGVVNPDLAPYNSSFIRYSALPHEIICTENLTPFRKLLPCGTRAGFSTLLNALNIFNAHYVSLSVDIQPVCMDGCSKVALELIQSVSIVFDPPVTQLKKQDWSFVKLFGASLTSTCPVASESLVFVDISSNTSSNAFTLNTEPSRTSPEKMVIYDLKSMFQSARHINIGAAYKNINVYGIIPTPPLRVDRKISGYGQEHGGIHCTFFNDNPIPIKIIYFDMVPWYMRLYSHTLIVKNGDKKLRPGYMHYQPAKDRIQPHHLELVLTLPSKSKTEMSIDFDFAFLKWTEYPPDANHGFYAGAAVVSAELNTPKNNITKLPIQNTRSDTEENFVRIYTQVLLVSLPTPDFSMPYNVICLTCTVVALAFGPIHNITTKSLQPLDEKEQGFITKLKKKLNCWWKSRNKEDEPKEEDFKKVK